MKRFLKPTLVFSICLALVLSLPACSNTNAPNTPNNDSANSVLTLEKGNWYPKTRAAIDEFLQSSGKNASDYDKNNKPYAVFDFDDTTSIFDSENALFVWQIDNLYFKFKPAEIDYFIYGLSTQKDKIKQIPDIENLATDIRNDYKFLYNNYQGLAGDSPLKNIKKTNEFIDFKAKVLALMNKVSSSESGAFYDAWSLNFYFGFNSDEINTLCQKAYKEILQNSQQTLHIAKGITSPADLPGKTGVVSVEYVDYLVIPDETKDLYKKLSNNGFDIFIVSASLQLVIENLVKIVGLDIPTSHVYGMRLETNQNQLYNDKYEPNYPITWGNGKVQIIKKYIMPNKNQVEPAMICGDSNGDYNNFTTFSKAKVMLIFNHAKDGKIADLAKGKGQLKGPQYLLQGHDEANGVFLVKQTSETVDTFVKYTQVK